MPKTTKKLLTHFVNANVGLSLFKTPTWNSTAQTIQYVRHREKRFCGTRFELLPVEQSNPLGDNHSKKNMENVAAWMATAPTSIQDAVSKGSKKAVGEIIPVRFATTMATPVSIKGTLKSTTASRSEFIINDVNTWKWNNLSNNYCKTTTVTNLRHIIRIRIRIDKLFKQKRMQSLALRYRDKENFCQNY